MPKVSVIVPVYNAERYLAQCVDSILAQTLQDMQVILVDDGSTDSSPAICDAYAGKDRRVQVIHKVNGRAASARNAGLRAAAGEYVAFVDADDWISPEMYEAMLAEGARSFPFPSPTWRKASMTGRRCGSRFFLTWLWTAWNFPLPFPTVYC